MYPIIIIDGADCSGKTTLAKHFCEKYNCHYMHLTYRFPKNMFEYQLAAVNRAIKIARTKPVVIDRLWISEKVYAKVFRNGSTWPYMGRCLDRILQRFGATYIFCIRDSENHIAHFDSIKANREEMYDSMNEVIEEYKTVYSKIQKRHDVTSYDMDTDGNEMDSFSDMVYLHTLERLGESRRIFLNPDKQYFAGYFEEEVSQKKLLFVGGSMNEYRGCNYPYVGYKALGFNEINKSLDDIGLDETKIIWANIRDDLDKLVLTEYTFDNPKVIVVELGSQMCANFMNIDYAVRSIASFRGIYEGQKLFAEAIDRIVKKEGI